MSASFLSYRPSESGAGIWRVLVLFLIASIAAFPASAEEASGGNNVPSVDFPSFDLSFGIEIDTHSFEPDWQTRWKTNEEAIQRETPEPTKADLLWERFQLKEEANSQAPELEAFGREALNALSKLDPKSAQHHLREAYIHAKAGRGRFASESIRKAWESDPDDPNLYPEVLRIFTALPDYDRIHPGCAFSLRSWVFHGRETLDLMIEATRENPDPDILLARAMIEEIAQKGESFLRKALLRNRWSENSSLWAQFENSLNEAAIPDRGLLPWLDQALATAPDRIDIRRERTRLDVTFRLSEVLLGRRQIDDAQGLQRTGQFAVAALFQSILGFDSPDEASTWVNSVIMQCFTEADTNLPFHAELSFLRLLFSEEDAIPWTTEQMLQHPDDPRWVDRYMLLRIANSVGLSQAQEWVTQAHESDLEPLRKAFREKESIRSGMVLARCMYSTGQYEEATAILQKLLELDPSNAWHPTALASIQFRQDGPDDVILSSIDLAFDRLKGHDDDLRSTLWLYLANARWKRKDTLGTIDAMIIAAWLGDPATLKGWQDLSFLPDPEPLPWASAAEFVSGTHPDSHYNKSVFFANTVVHQIMRQPDTSLDKARRLLEVLTREVSRQWERDPEMDTASKISSLNHFLRNRIHFDYFSEGIESSLFANTLLRRAGNCVGQSLVYTLLARNLGLDCTARILPGHMIAQYFAPTSSVAIECTDGFREITDLMFFRKHFPDENAFQSWANVELKLNMDAHLGLTQNTLSRIGESNQRDLSEAIFHQFKTTDFIHTLLPSIAESHLLLRTVSEAPPTHGPWTPRGLDVTRLIGNQIYEARYQPTPLGIETIEKLGKTTPPLLYAIHSWHTGNRDKALSIITRLPGYPARNLALEWSLQLAEAGNPALALEVLKAVLDNVPNDTEIQVRIAQILEQTGKRDEARQVAMQILQVIPFQAQALSIASN